MAELPPLFPEQTEEEIYNMFLEDLPDPIGGGTWNTRVGSVLHSILQPLVLERLRLVSYSIDALAMGFLEHATGSALDSKAAEFGVFRTPAAPSSVTLTFTGTPSTNIPQASRVSSVGDAGTGDPGIEFATTSAAVVGGGGTITVGAQALQSGTRSNVDPSTITILVDALPGITSVTNIEAATGGTDEQDDASLRATALVRAASIPASGNQGTYIAQAFQQNSVGSAAVEDLWDGNGTGRLILVGKDGDAHVPPSTVDTLQTQIDPSVKCLAHFEGSEVWSDGGDLSATSNTTTPLEGAASVTATTLARSQGWMITPVNLDLLSWDASNDSIRLELEMATAAANLSTCKLAFLSSTSPINVEDRFSTDSTADYTFDAGSGTTSIADGVLKATTTATKRLAYKPATYAPVDKRSIWIKHTTGTTLTGYETGVIIKRIDASNYLYASVDNAGNVAIKKVVADTPTTLSTGTSGALSTATSYWLEASILGDNVEANLWAALPHENGTPTTQRTHTLAGGDATQFGTGVAGATGIYWAPAATDATVDDFYVDPQINGVEALWSGATIAALGGGSGKGMFETTRAGFTTFGTGFSWNSIGYIRIMMFTDTGGSSAVTFDGLRIVNEDGQAGTGIAPIGIQMTVRSAAKTPIDIEATVYTVEGTILDDVAEGLKTAIAQAIIDTPPGAESIKLATIANAIHDYPNITDYTGVKLARAGGALTAANVTLGAFEVPRAGSINLIAG